ncbi:MAG: hypothetical protein RLY14_2918 [Planctomycetota bacterium]|jgi:hypothetical protein
MTWLIHRINVSSEWEANDGVDEPNRSRSWSNRIQRSERENIPESVFRVKRCPGSWVNLDLGNLSKGIICWTLTESLRGSVVW